LNDETNSKLNVFKQKIKILNFNNIVCIYAGSLLLSRNKVGGGTEEEEEKDPKLK